VLFLSTTDANDRSLRFISLHGFWIPVLKIGWIISESEHAITSGRQSHEIELPIRMDPSLGVPAATIGQGDAINMRTI